MTVTIMEQLFVALPHELMPKIREYSTLSGILNLAQCSKAMRRHITTECAALWTEIDFSKEEQCKLDKLDDTMLHYLLTRVNAGGVTKVLNLMGCSSIEGWGMIPLNFSRLVERVYLRPTDGNALVENKVVAMLRTMVPYKLWDVRDPSGRLSIVSDVFQKFLFDLHEAKRQQAIAQQTLCNRCQHPVADEARQIVPYENGMALSYCTQCGHQYCRKGSCSMSLLDCLDCKIVTSCESCDFVRKCDVCNRTSCKVCFGFIGKLCMVCNRALCQDCTASIYCDDCEMTLCNDCSDATHGMMYQYCCHTCNSTFCGSSNCRKMEYCIVCDSVECSKCSAGGMNVCDRCKNTYCSEVAACGFACQGCEQDFCYRCVSSNDCSKFNGIFYSDGCSNGSCDLCEKAVCTQCNPGEDACDFSFCAICGTPFCGDCKGASCGDCDSTFCHGCHDETEGLVRIMYCHCIV